MQSCQMLYKSYSSYDASHKNLAKKSYSTEEITGNTTLAIGKGDTLFPKETICLIS